MWRHGHIYGLPTYPPSGGTLRDVGFNEASGGERGRVQRGNKVTALEVSAIEGKNALHGKRRPWIFDPCGVEYLLAPCP